MAIIHFSIHPSLSSILISIFIMNHLSREGAEKLPDFTTQSHPIQDGRYVVKHATEEFAEAKDDQIQSTVWFRTPVICLTIPLPAK